MEITPQDGARRGAEAAIYSLLDRDRVEQLLTEWSLVFPEPYEVIVRESDLTEAAVLDALHQRIEQDGSLTAEGQFVLGHLLRLRAETAVFEQNSQAELE